MSQITKFRVFGRVRPFIETEFEGKQSSEIRSVIEMVDNKTIILDPKENYTPKAQFDFDDSLWSIPQDYKMLHTYGDGGGTQKDFASQLYVYDLVGRECPENAFNGINSTIMSYGQTGSGKTYTMMGKYDPFSVCGGDGPEGIIPRVCHDVFQLVEKKRSAELQKEEKDRVEITVEVTFVEIYMEKVRDLLDRHAAARGEMREARIRVDPSSGPFVEDVTKYRVSNWAHCCKLLEQGSSQRTTSANVVHAQSSRSHAIFTLTLLQTKKIPPKDKYSAATVETKAGRINLVDLAGSERGGFTDYVKESAKINTSLLALRRVIDTLVERQRIMMEQVSAEISGQPLKGPPQVAPTVPYRDSVLTWLLSDSMGGNAMTTMIAALSPHEKNFNDTLATLQWSSKARNLVGVVKVNDTQSSVQSGMLGKRSDLQSSISAQRQTVDGLRQELENMKTLAADFDKKSLNLKKKYVAMVGDKEQQIAVGAVLSIQRSYRSWRHRARMTLLGRQLDDKMAAIGEKQQQLQAAKASLDSTDAEFTALSQDAATRRQRLAALEKQLAQIEADEPEFAKRYAVALEMRTAGESQIDDLRQQLAADEAKIVKEHEEAVVLLVKARERFDSDTRRLQMMQTEIAAVTVDEQEAMRREAERIEAANRAKEDKLAPQRAKRDELLAKKQELQKEIDKKKKKK